MDIRKWLDDIVLPEQPPSPRSPNGDPPAPLLESHAPEALPKQGHRRKRKRSTTDSSLLHARTAQPKSPSPITKGPDTDKSGATTSRSHAHQPPDPSSGSSSSSQRYARRPRRKTRPDRYEPKSKDAKGQGAHASRHRDRESKRKKKESTRNRAGKAGIGRIQSFHAKNVPQGRLTLKPHEKPGLFNKGRVSSPVKGRGLPDLVFSEMKFLQRHKDQPEATSQSGLARKKRNKDHAHAKEGEISAYFTSVPPALAERDVNTQAKGATGRGAVPERAERECGRSTLNAPPTAENPERAPFLGFGGRGPQHRSGSGSGSGSYISWSESIRAPSVAPQPLQARASSVLDTGQLGSVRGSNYNRSACSGGHVLHSPAPPTPSRELPNGSVARLQLSSLTPQSRQPSWCRSFPQGTSSSWPTGVNGCHEGRQTVGTAYSLPSMPSTRPIRSEARRDHPSAACAREGDDPEQASLRWENCTRSKGAQDVQEPDGAYQDPQTSSTLGRLLHACDSALEERYPQAPVTRGPSRGMNHPDSILNGEGNRVHMNITETNRRPPVVRFSGVQTYRPLTTEYAGPSIYEEQERREQNLTMPQPRYEDVGQDFYPLDKEEELDEWEEEMEDWDVLVEEPAMVGYNNARRCPEDDRERSHLEKDVIISSGFWRPHRLY